MGGFFHYFFPPFFFFIFFFNRPQIISRVSWKRMGNGSRSGGQGRAGQGERGGSSREAALFTRVYTCMYVCLCIYLFIARPFLFSPLRLRIYVNHFLLIVDLLLFFSFLFFYFVVRLFLLINFSPWFVLHKPVE
uniref:Uncharacterized protein n=1 Tax=Trypanosoma congolense (strain IL3000) TaxID=1068625 RepID=G0UR76_TRYCI|nr:hypothetical protein, unlikely [Trypanosoma congolense IL3000]